MDYQDIIITCVIGYVVGTLQPAFYLGKLRGIDIREHGSKNAGAANTSLIMGKTLGIITALIDILKATFTVWIIGYLQTAGYIFSESEAAYNLLPFLGGAISVLGHNYPFYMGFKGGKGTACVLGMMVGYDPYWGLGMIAVMLLSTIVSNYVVIGTVNIYIVIICLTYFKYESYELLGISVLLATLGIYKHRMNFVRIMKGTETTFRGNL